MSKKDYDAAYYQVNKERKKLARKLFYEANRERIREEQRLWRLTPRAKQKRKESDKRAETPQVLVARSVRNRLRIALGRKKWIKTQDLLGCDWAELTRYLESLFTDGMSWSNRGVDGWHIDHIRPLVSFDLTDPEQLKIACHYSNLQPLWACDNIRKGAHWEEISA